MTLRVFGSPSLENLKAAERAAFHSRNIFLAVMDNAALWEESTLTQIVTDLPANLKIPSDVYLLMAECVSNAAVHAKADILAFYIRRRKKIVLFSFFQNPPMSEATANILAKARRGALPDYLLDAPGGLGFPILVRLSKNMTLSGDRQKLHLWFRV